MPKLVEVERCEECPHVHRWREWDREVFRFCTHAAIGLREVEQEVPTPAWCPIPDADSGDRR